MEVIGVDGRVEHTETNSWLTLTYASYLTYFTYITWVKSHMWIKLSILHIVILAILFEPNQDFYFLCLTLTKLLKFKLHSQYNS